MATRATINIRNVTKTPYRFPVMEASEGKPFDKIGDIWLFPGKTTEVDKALWVKVMDKPAVRKMLETGQIAIV